MVEREERMLIGGQLVESATGATFENVAVAAARAAFDEYTEVKSVATPP